MNHNQTLSDATRYVDSIRRGTHDIGGLKNEVIQHESGETSVIFKGAGPDHDRAFACYEMKDNIPTLTLIPEDFYDLNHHNVREKLINPVYNALNAADDIIGNFTDTKIALVNHDGVKSGIQLSIQDSLRKRHVLRSLFNHMAHNG